jgi:hypothetical protein
MTEAPSNPGNKRRQWLGAAMLAVVAIIVGRQFLPRADARFVGRWQGRHLLDLQAGGRGSLTNSTGEAASIRWWFDGQVLCLELIPANEPTMTKLQSLVHRVAATFGKGFRPNGRQLVYWVDDVTTEAIEYRICHLMGGRFKPFGTEGHQFMRLPE